MESLPAIDHQVYTLRQQVAAAESQLAALRIQLEQAEQRAQSARQVQQAYLGGMPAEWIQETLEALEQDDMANISQAIRQNQIDSPEAVVRRRFPLDADEYKRYGRQMILPELGLHGQLRLRKAKVLVIGVGGLGCPAAAYLAGAGVGTLGLVDGDTVEVSNLHRQIAHGTARIGMQKVESAYEYLASLNPSVNYLRYPSHLAPDEACALFDQYDLVLDCTDHPTSRYLISDACVLARKPLVSASALKTEGQLLVLNNPPKPPGDSTGGPCYRCVFPRPPPADSVLSCSEGGILGPVVGVMGVLQALEAIKLLTAPPSPASTSSTTAPEEPSRPTLLMFSAYSTPPFRSVRLRSRRADCAACSAAATVSRRSLTSGSLDYTAFCGATAAPALLPPSLHISAGDFARLPTDGSNMLIDVRDETQYAMCALRGSVNVPWTGDAGSWLQRATRSGALADDGRQRFVVCRLGNDSQLAVKALVEQIELPVVVKNVQGGFRAWSSEVDAGWPDY